MKITLKQKLMGFALGVFSVSSFAQCPSITNLSVSYGANGSATVTPVISGNVSPAQTMYYWSTTPNVIQTSSIFDQQGTFQFPANGTYTICLSYNDSAAMCGSNYFCDVVNVTNATSTSCQAGFTYSTDSSCVTHFVNSSIGNNLTYQWSINGNMDASVNPNVNLQSGWNYVTLYSFSGGVFCDSIQQVIYVNCGGTVGLCNSAFTSYTDSSCVTHFTNTSTGSNLTYQWYDATNGFSLLSTQQNPNLNLPQGAYYISLYTYSNGQYCDSVTQFINVACGSNSVSCNASFSYYTDSTNCATYINSTSTGNYTSLVWTVDGSIFTGSNNFVMNLSNGTHGVYLTTYYNGQVCDSTYSTITVNCAPVIPDTLCQANASFYLFSDSTNTGNYFAYNLSSGTGNLSYLWNFGDGTTSTQQYPFHQYAVPGQYALCLTVTATNDSTTCTDTYCDSSSVQKMASGFLMSQIAIIPQSTTGVKDENIIKGIKAFPNPLNDILIIEMELGKNEIGLTCTLIDALGKVVMVNNITESKTSINTSQLDKGFYFLSVCNENGKTLKTIKLVK